MKYGKRKNICTDTEAENSGCTEENSKQKKRISSTADTIIQTIYILMFFIGGCFFIAWTAGISFALSVAGFLIYFFGVLIFFSSAAKSIIAKRLLWISRITGLFLMILAYCAPIICINFKTQSFMYPVKRFVYVYGVKPAAKDILPVFLSESPEDYYFRTEGSFPAQDYRPYSYLIFHTSEQALAEYENKLSQNSEYTKKMIQPKSDEEYDELVKKYSEEDTYMAYCPEELPRHVYNWLVKGAGITENLNNAVIYGHNSNSDWNLYSGALLNYETGLIVIWR